jgi:hypothetical protein
LYDNTQNVQQGDIVAALHETLKWRQALAQISRTLPEYEQSLMQAACKHISSRQTSPETAADGVRKQDLKGMRIDGSGRREEADVLRSQINKLLSGIEHRMKPSADAMRSDGQSGRRGVVSEMPQRPGFSLFASPSYVVDAQEDLGSPPQAPEEHERGQMGQDASLFSSPVEPEPASVEGDKDHKRRRKEEEDGFEMKEAREKEKIMTMERKEQDILLLREIEYERLRQIEAEREQLEKHAAMGREKKGDRQVHDTAEMRAPWMLHGDCGTGEGKDDMTGGDAVKDECEALLTMGQAIGKWESIGSTGVWSVLDYYRKLTSYLAPQYSLCEWQVSSRCLH